MKKLLLVFTLILSSELFAARGVVLVLEAPLFKRENSHSTIYQYVKKGETIFIHNKHVDDGHYKTQRERSALGYENDLDETAPVDSSYYTTSDRIGRTAFILKEHVKIIYNDTREFDNTVTRSRDDMDYRLPEPLPETYPLIYRAKHRSSVTLGMETNSQSNYDYQTDIETYDYANKFTLGFYYLRKANFDLEDRFYFGIKGAISFYRNEFLLDNGYSTSEVSNTYELGPFISYDFHKGESIRLSIHGGFFFNYHLMKIVQDSDDGYRDRQNYDGFFVAPFMGGTFAIKDVYGSTDLILGSDIKFVPPHSLKSKGIKYEDALWSEEDKVSYPAELQASLYLGLLTNF